MEKKCSKCQELKQLTCFNKNKRRADGLQTFCRDCMKEKCRSYYKENKEKQSKQIYAAKIKRREANNRRLANYFKNNPCVDCGEQDLLVLEFDHKHSKRAGVHTLLAEGYSWKAISNEIKKCDVRCANCHRRKTNKENGCWKLEYK